MSKIKKVLPFLIWGFALVTQPCMGQAWVKAGKVVSKQAVKALSKKPAKTTTVIRRTTQRTTTGTASGYAGYGNVGRSAAMASQYVKVTCSTCSGRGYYVYNGYRYQCPSCSGYGYRIVKR